MLSRQRRICHTRYAPSARRLTSNLSSKLLLAVGVPE